MKIGKTVSEKYIESVIRRLETLELESYMKAFSEFMECPVKIDDPSEINHLVVPVLRRWMGQNDGDKLRTFVYTLGLLKFLSLHTSVDVKRASREFSDIVYEKR